MERKVLLVCCVVGFLGLLSAATSFGAEATRIKVTFLSVLCFLWLALLRFIGCPENKRNKKWIFLISFIGLFII